MYEYLIGVLTLAGLVWLIAFFYRSDLIRKMVWSGIVCTVILTIAFIILRILFFLGLNDSSIVPDYWNPDTLFNLGRITGGYAIEDVLFTFLFGGLAGFIYEYFTKKEVKIKKTKRHNKKALIAFIVAGGLFYSLFDINIIYSLIVGGAVSTSIIWIDRRDLIKHSLYGGSSFLVIYFLAFLLFNTIFPGFISTVYNLQDISGILIFGVPLEELLFAIIFGSNWSPVYEYWYGK